MTAWGTLVGISSARSVPRQEPTDMPRLALYALIVCLLAVAAAVVSFVQGSWLGIVWVLLAGLSSNMCWYYLKRGKADRSVTG
jgi:CHASE2 domain-containing sensor protein